MTLKGLYATAAVIAAISTQTLTTQSATATEVKTKNIITGQIIRQGELNLQIGENATTEGYSIKINRAVVKGDLIQIVSGDKRIASFDTQSPANSINVSGAGLNPLNEYQVFLNGDRIF